MDKPEELQGTSTKPASERRDLLVDRRDLLAGAATLAGTSLIGLGLPTAAAAAEAAQDRMPPIPVDQMTEAQKAASAELIAGPRKALVGPFIPLLRSPDLMSRLQKVGEYLRFNTKLGSNISEFIILQMARHMTQEFEWDSHVDLALKAGIKQETINAVADGRRPESMTQDEEIVYDFCEELRKHQSVSDAAYARIAKRFGEQGVIDICALCGYYTTLAYVMNVARTPLPPGRPVPLAPFPR